MNHHSLMYNARSANIWAVAAAFVAVLYVVIFPTYVRSDASKAHVQPLIGGQFSALSGNEAVVISQSGVYETLDGGRHWKAITPPVIAKQPVLLAHVGGVYTFARRSVWLTLIGDSRTDFMLYSHDNGSTWHISALPGNAVAVRSTLSFTSVSNGRVLGALPGVHGKVVLMTTTSGARAWRPTATVPFAGPVTWSGALDGIGVATVPNSGARLYRTRDGGLTWHKAALPPSLLGSILTIDHLQFLGADRAVAGGVTDRPGEPGEYHPLLIETLDDGAHWQALPAPKMAAVHSTTGIQFAAAGTSDFMFYHGAYRYVSADMGRHWTQALARLPVGYHLLQVHVATKTVSWAVATGPALGNLYPTYLLRSSDDGASWSLSGP